MGYDTGSYDDGVVPPILEVYVVWHPEDREGAQIAAWLLEHFRGAPYSGLVGGAVEVYTRSEPWQRDSDAPRPLPCQVPLPYQLPHAQVTAVVPVLGVRLARAFEQDSSDWRGYLDSIHATAEAGPDKKLIGVFPVRLQGTVESSSFGEIGSLQALHSASCEEPAALCRELSQAVAQLVGDPFGERLRVFISHTKRHPVEEEPDYVDELVGRVRTAIADTHLQAYFDAADLQPGADWEHELRSQAASSALLAVRTDLYASREWCQREFLVAKRAGMPIVTLNGVCRAEERGSFLMDHVPAVGYRQADEGLRQSSVEEALNLLVDAALTRALWGLQQVMLEQLGFDWIPLHAPEPVTVLPWLLENRQRATEEGPLLIMHPDPPLGPEETRVLSELFEVAGVRDAVDVVTPRTYMSRATRGH